jgi:hypothetical protein
MCHLESPRDFRPQLCHKHLSSIRHKTFPYVRHLVQESNCD